MRWTGSDEGEIEVEEEFEGTAAEPDDERPVTLAVVPAQRTQEVSE